MTMHFHRTCRACPEQYDVFTKVGGRKIGYVRLRWGGLAASFTPKGRLGEEHGEKEVYSMEFPDPTLGDFPSEDQRRIHLKRIERALRQALRTERTK